MRKRQAKKIFSRVNRGSTAYNQAQLGRAKSVILRREDCQDRSDRTAVFTLFEIARFTLFEIARRRRLARQRKGRLRA